MYFFSLLLFKFNHVWLKVTLMCKTVKDNLFMKLQSPITNWIKSTQVLFKSVAPLPWNKL